MCGRGNNGKPVRLNDFRHAAAQPNEFRVCLLNRAADARAYLDLRLEKLGCNLVFQYGFSILQQLLGDLLDQIAGFPVNDHVLLFNAYRQTGLFKVVFNDVHQSSESKVR